MGTHGREWHVIGNEFVGSRMYVSMDHGQYLPQAIGRGGSAVCTVTASAMSYLRVFKQTPPAGYDIGL